MALTQEEARNQAMEQVSDYATARQEQFVEAKEAWKEDRVGNKPIRPFVVAAVVDKETGETYLGESLGSDKNRMLQGDEIHPHLANAMQVPSLETWATENCAEFNAVNDALQAGAKPENLVVSAMHIARHEFKEPCNNCQSMTERLGIDVAPTPKYEGRKHEHDHQPSETHTTPITETEPLPVQLRSDLAFPETVATHEAIFEKLAAAPAVEDIKSAYTEAIKGANENAETREGLGLDTKKAISGEYNKEVATAQESVGERVSERFSQIKGAQDQLSQGQKQGQQEEKGIKA